MAVFGFIVWSVLDVQAVGMRSFEIRDLDEDDLAYVQEWDLLTNPPTPEQWREALAEHSHIINGFRRLTPEDAQEYIAGRQWWITEHVPRYSPPPHSGERFLPGRTTADASGRTQCGGVAFYRHMDQRFRPGEMGHPDWFVFGGSRVLVLVGPPVPT